MSTSDKNSWGVSFFTLLLLIWMILGPVTFFLFLLLKLIQVGLVASWSWWAVTAPLWAPGLVILALVIVMRMGVVLFNILRSFGENFH